MHTFVGPWLVRYHIEEDDRGKGWVVLDGICEFHLFGQQVIADA